MGKQNDLPVFFLFCWIGVVLEHHAPTEPLGEAEPLAVTQEMGLDSRIAFAPRFIVVPSRKETLIVGCKELSCRKGILDRKESVLGEIPVVTIRKPIVSSKTIGDSPQVL